MATALDDLPAAAGSPRPAAGGTEAAQGPWAIAGRKLRRDRAAMAALVGLVLIVLACLLAPAYARWVSGTDPFRSNLDGEIVVAGETVPIMQASTEGLGLGFAPDRADLALGPYLLGADSQGRDVAARLLYGGRNSLLIGGAATLICLSLAALVGIVAGYFGGIVDLVLARLLDVLWAFPVYLLAISLSIVLIAQGLTIGPITIRSGSLLAADRHHRHRLRALCRAADPRPGHRAQAQRVRAGRRSAWACPATASCCATSCPTSPPA